MPAQVVLFSKNLSNVCFPYAHGNTQALDYVTRVVSSCGGNVMYQGCDPRKLVENGHGDK